jgi:hypothetical protein
MREKVSMTVNIPVIPQDASFDLRFIPNQRVLMIRHRIAMPQSYKDSS